MARPAVYFISVAARLANMHPTSLRKYERAGFLEPSRTKGKVRLYSDDDIWRLQQIKCLVEEWGTDMQGVERALDLTDRVFQLMDVIETQRDDARLRDSAREVLRDMLRILGLKSTCVDVGQSPATNESEELFADEYGQPQRSRPNASQRQPC